MRYLLCLSRIMNLEQRVNIRFCFKFQKEEKKNAMEVHEMLKSVQCDNVAPLKTVYKQMSDLKAEINRQVRPFTWKRRKRSK